MNVSALRLFALLLAFLPVVAGCGSLAATPNVSTSAPAVSTPVELRTALLTRPDVACTNRFVAHSLPYQTTAGVVKMFESNGSGLAVNDLDGDGDADLVFANLKDANAVLWNEGGLRFRKELFPHGDSRAATIVDVDGDGRQDILFTRRTLSPTLWRNTGRGSGLDRFTEEALGDIDQKLYAVNWADFDADGDLDLAAASYNAALARDLGYDFMRTGSGAGVFVFTNEGDRFTAWRLAEEAQALAVAVPDLNEDGKPDLLVGNDFGKVDQAWQQEPTGWQLVQPFVTTTHSTMSIDLGDIDNDGQVELFATDMKPYDWSVRTVAQWRPMLTKMPNDTFVGDPQIMENVLQVRDASGKFRNLAYQRSLDATGWSWSGKFGDLDNDGWLDLYVVNGMLAEDLLNYLPGHELIEENRAFRNRGRGDFVLAPEWGLGSKRSGRSMSMADLDVDGDLDIIVNNLESPAQIFENQLCGGTSLEVDLAWHGSKNTRAIGAKLVLHTSAGAHHRDVRAASGYLSGDPSRVHFGFPSEAELRQLEIRWPDGTLSTVDTLAPQTLLTVTRNVP